MSTSLFFSVISIIPHLVFSLIIPPLRIKRCMVVEEYSNNNKKSFALTLWVTVRRSRKINVVILGKENIRVILPLIVLLSHLLWRTDDFADFNEKVCKVQYLSIATVVPSSI